MMALTKWVFLTCVTMALSGTVHGAIVGGNSSAEFIDVGLDLELGSLSVVNAQIHGYAQAEDTAPAPYNSTVSIADAEAHAGPVPLIVTVADVTAREVTSQVSSTVDGANGLRMASGSHSITNLDFSLVDLPVLPDLISITADAINVTSGVTGDYGALASAGTLDVTNLVITVSGVALETLNGTIGPNFGVALGTGLGGASLILNEQIPFGDGINYLGLTTNAISLKLTDVGVDGIGTLNGNVTIGQTFASLDATAVPEPSSAILLGLVCAGGAWARRRSKHKATLTLAA